MKFLFKHWIVIVLLLVVAWYVVHKNCAPCQARLAAMMGGGKQATV